MCVRVYIYIYIYIYIYVHVLSDFEHSGDISCSILVNPSHTDESWGGRNMFMCIYIYIHKRDVYIYIYISQTFVTL